MRGLNALCAQLQDILHPFIFVLNILGSPCQRVG